MNKGLDTRYDVFGDAIKLEKMMLDPTEVILITVLVL